MNPILRTLTAVLTALLTVPSTGHAEPARPTKSPSAASKHDAQQLPTNAATTNRLKLITSTIVRGQVSDLEKLLAEGLDVNFADETGATLLHVAAMANRDDMAITLLNKGANPYATQKPGISPLSMAALNDCVNTISTLISIGKVDVNHSSDTGITPLMAACTRGNIDSVQVLLAHGADPNVHDAEGMAPILYTFLAPEFCSEIVLSLLEHGADPEYRNPEGLTPLQAAVGKGDIRTAAVLLKHGANVNTPSFNNFSPLIEALCRGNIPMVRLLLNNGADVNPVGTDNIKPINCAATSAIPEMLELLIAKGANPNTTDPNGQTPLAIVADGNRVKLAVAAAVNPQHFLLRLKDNMDSVASARLLLDKGACVDQADRSNFTPLMRAAMCGDTRLVSTLLQANATVNAQCDDGRTPLIYAVLPPQEKANRFCKFEPGLQPLHNQGKLSDIFRKHSVERQVIEALLRSGANPRLKDKSGKSALDYADHPDIRQLLEKAAEKQN